MNVLKWLMPDILVVAIVVFFLHCECEYTPWIVAIFNCGAVQEALLSVVPTAHLSVNNNVADGRRSAAIAVFFKKTARYFAPPIFYGA